MCNEQITWSEGVPCEWAVPFITLAVILGVAIGVGIALLLIKLYERVTEWWDDRKEAKTTWVPQIMWANDGDTARIVTELNARKQKHHLKFNGRCGLFSTASFRLKCSRCGKQTIDIQRGFWDLAFDTDDHVFRPLVEKQLTYIGELLGPCPGSIEEQYQDAVRSLRGFWGTEGFDV